VTIPVPNPADANERGLKLALTPEASPPALLQQEIRLPEYASRTSNWDWHFALAPDGSSYVYADTAAGVGHTA